MNHNNALSRYNHYTTNFKKCLSKNCAIYFLSFLLGIVLACQPRRTVTSWIQSSSLCHYFRNFLSFAANLSQQ
jgi:hypothetical protein